MNLKSNSLERMFMLMICYLLLIYALMPVDLRLEKTWKDKMQTEADFEIINLNPNIIYEDSESDDDFVMDEEEEEKTDVNVLVEEIENNDSMQSNSNDSFGSLVENNVKRKRLNLQEYKIKRANQPAPVMINKKNVLELCEIIPDTLPSISLPTDPRAIKNFLNQISLNKQLELQQEQYQDEEQLIKEPVREEISVQQIVDIHPDYEEIVLVSIECNTDISIPPNEGEDMIADQSKTAIESKYLTNIVNNFEKNSNAKCLLANSSANSLFSSINAVLQEKCKSNSSSENDKRIENKSIVEHHGEDKFIMHLRKDRIRPLRSAISIQTDVTPLFPPLILSPALIFNRIKNIRSYRRRSSRSRSRSRSRSISPESDYYGHGNYNYHNSSDFNSRFAHSTYTSSMNSSEMESYSSDSDSSAYSSGRSSDQESIKRFDKYKNYRMFKQRNGISQAPYRGRSTPT